MVAQQLTKLKRLLSITPRPNEVWKQNDGVLRLPKQLPYIKQGLPVMGPPPVWLEAPPTGSFRKYRGPPKQHSHTVLRDPNAYSPDGDPIPHEILGEQPTIPFHELIGKFRFEVQGRFFNNAENAEREAFWTAFDLHLKGWLKVRKNFMLGHLQGDVYALAYFRRWLEEKRLTRTAGVIHGLRIHEVNIGLTKPLQFGNLTCIKDKRKYGKRKVHLLMSMEQTQIAKLERDSVLKRREEEEELDRSAVQNY